MSSGRTLIAGVLAVALLAAAQLVGHAGRHQRDAWPHTVDDPYAPSPDDAAFVTLGYRELGADLLYIRLRVYYGGDDDTARGFRALVDAIVALDPTLLPVYDYTGNALSWVDGGITQDDWRWAATVLEKGIERFPTRWQILKLAGEVYTLELESDDPEQERQWRERGLELLEHAIHTPGAPHDLATYVAYLRTELGQQQRAIEGLTELIRTARDDKEREKLIKKLAELQGANADQILAEELLMKDLTDRAHERALPMASLEMYLLLGDPPKPYIDLGDLSASQQLILDQDLLSPVEDFH